MEGPILEARGVTKSFGGLKAVQNVSFSIMPGEFVGLIGPNGAGKTTLFNLVAGFYKADQGRILLEGRDITGLKPYKICRLGIGRTFQVVRPLPNLTVLENIVTAALLHHRDYREAREVALGVAERAGLGTRLEKRAGGVPIPDKKRLSFAQALATGAKVLLLDEVMAGLNPTEIDEFLRILREVASGGLTILMVEHIMRAVMSVAGRVLVLDHGELICEGKPEEVAQDERVIKAYLGERYRYQRPG
ncbi:MAG: ABC transporter ATP-binding protein [Spirochaetales bacterium]|nr:ABC transporter ATP-binding protein [Spirochaetales bacterium]